MQRSMTTNVNDKLGAEIAPGVYEIGGNHFDSHILKTGNEAEKITERLHWEYGTNVGVYIGWVPDELLTESGATEGPAHKFFGEFGKISRIEFVPKFNAERKQSGHMAFVHFEYWYIDANFRFQNNIAKAHPQPYEVKWTFTNRFGKRKDYMLKCCINTNPIRKVDYNTSQLTDMFERLNTRVTEQMQKMQATIESLEFELCALKNSESAEKFLSSSEHALENV